MKWSLTDTMWEVTSLLLREIALLTVGRLLFFTFGFESERPWQFVLFMMAFFAPEYLLELLWQKDFGLGPAKYGDQGGAAPGISGCDVRIFNRADADFAAAQSARHPHQGAGGLRLCCLSGRQRAAGQDVETMASKKQGIISLLFSFIGEKVCAPCAAR